MTPVAPVQLSVDALAVGGLARRPLLFLEFRYPRFEFAGALLQDAAKLLRLAAQLVLGDLLQLRIQLVDPIDYRLHAAALPLMTGAHYR